MTTARATTTTAREADAEILTTPGHARAGRVLYPCAVLRFLLLLLSVALATPALAAPAPPALTVDDVDTQGYRWMFGSQQPVPATGAAFKTWRSTLVLDEIETIDLTVAFDLRVARPKSTSRAEPSFPLLVIDASVGTWCDGHGVQVEEVAAPAGFEHLGEPRACVVTLPETTYRRGGTLIGSVVAHTPRQEYVEDRFAMALPVQPLVHPAERVEMAVEYTVADNPRIRADHWGVELGRQVLDKDRERIFVALEDVAPVPLAGGASSIVGRVPTLLVDSGESWDEVATFHSVFYDNAARAKGAVLRMAGAVFAQPDVPSAAVEAVIQALDGTELDTSGGSGGAWRLPLPALATAEEGKGTAADRAALLVALLRTADVKAEVLLLSGSSVPVGPDEPLPMLDTTLVVVPNGAADGRDLYVDPSRGSLWLGSLPEELLDRDALLLSRSGARWARTPSAVPGRSWTLNASERTDGAFDISIRGELTGAPAARLREWLVAGRDDAGFPAPDLAWVTGWSEDLTPRFHSPDGTRLIVRATGTVPRERAVPGGFLTGPVVPVVAPDVGVSRWPYPRDARRLDFELLESWTFRGLLSGPVLPPGNKVTPFCSVESEGAWSGPVLTRRSLIKFSARQLPRDASVEVERFDEFLARMLGEVKAPAKSPEQ